MGAKVGTNWITLTIEECILGAVYAATRSDGEPFAIKMFVWEESTLTKMRLRHPSADSFLRELEFMLELKPISRHFVEFYAVDVDKFMGLGKCF